MAMENLMQQRQMTLISAFEQIVVLSEESKLDEDFFVAASTYIDYISERLNLSVIQVVLLALFLNQSDDRDIELKDIASYIGLKTISVLKYACELEELEKREYIYSTKSYNKAKYYHVPYRVIEAFEKNEEYKTADMSGLTCREFIDELDLFEPLRSSEMSLDTATRKIQTLLDKNPQLKIVEKINSYHLAGDEIMLLLFIHRNVHLNDNEISFHNFRCIFPERRELNRVKEELCDGNHALQECKLIEYVNSNGFIDRESYRLSRKAMSELLSEVVKKDGKDTNQIYIKSESITPKSLFYNPEVKDKVDELASFLQEQNYKLIRDRMKESGFRTAFTCLFYGTPGTGKTETAMQLAKQSGRDVMLVDLSSIKSAWVGESESNVKAIFDEYRSLVYNNDITPILLRNEADGILCSRKEDAKSAVDKMENTLQNIILQEMEKLDGILIATTNLQQNMDAAFRRRWLYYLNFTKPSQEARANIWQSMIPGLTLRDAEIVAQKYNLSGGQIENVARRYTIGTILHGERSNVLDELCMYSESELVDSKSNRKIGF
jgi:AAA+ superfamily predicted ATPase